MIKRMFKRMFKKVLGTHLLAGKKRQYVWTGHSAGFTLMELLVVMAIIAGIAALLLPTLRKARKRALIGKAEVAITSLETALSMYESDFSDYPSGNGEDCKNLVFLLQGPIVNDSWHGPYMRFKEKELKDGNFIDPWECSYRYRYPQAKHLNVAYLIYSNGPDMVFGTEDDITNW